ncbi:hypothetical protein [Anaerosacchariphilus polymeriproducens]|uniref:Uncharacterized protein n=1 Tax=Anaerosacchariphilus polymeriproducens TaxID=1812858 RepID=A0A371ATX2_9FIRM|nr:hypothetical protein [Anaerosacchariphilus polymeriproducens]RDU23008.1 hypothetical protein DWV06_11615 [Anaerosacchariphilus polymeriproducens]
MKETEKLQEFEIALQDKKIPVLTLDHKWHCLFQLNGKPQSIQELEENLNVLLRRQGQLNSDLKESKRLKVKLMRDIVANMENVSDKEREKKQEENQKLIIELNETIEQYEDELLEIPSKIKKVNSELMIASMDVCYDTLKQNENDITEITEWIKHIRVELKKNIIRKQNKELKNQQIYSYMHDIFGPEVVDLFDMAYIVEEENETVEDK